MTTANASLPRRYHSYVLHLPLFHPRHPLSIRLFLSIFSLLVLFPCPPTPRVTYPPHLPSDEGQPPPPTTESSTFTPAFWGATSVVPVLESLLRPPCSPSSTLASRLASHFEALNPCRGLLCPCCPRPPRARPVSRPLRRRDGRRCSAVIGSFYAAIFTFLLKATSLCR